VTVVTVVTVVTMVTVVTVVTMVTMVVVGVIVTLLEVEVVRGGGVVWFLFEGIVVLLLFGGNGVIVALRGLVVDVVTVDVDATGHDSAPGILSVRGTTGLTLFFLFTAFTRNS